MIGTSKELFVNMTRIPDEKSQEYDSFFEAERNKITYGLTINGVYIHGWLYWHLNHWHIYKDALDPINGEVINIFRNPDFRDNEWYIAEHIKKAEEQKKGLLIFGSRRFAKTYFEASWLGRGATIYQGSENILSSTNEADIKLLAAATDKGLSAMHPYFKFDRLNDDWRKEIALGYKEKRQGGKKYEWSKILVRNLDEGRNTEAIAGTKPKTLVIDEIGKCEKIMEAFEAAKPGFTSMHGWRCVPILTGTGGAFIPNSDAEKMFNEPEAHNFLGVEWLGKTKKFGLFVPRKYRMEGKVKTKFGDYIKTEKGILIPEDSELNSIEFYASDAEKANIVTKEEIARAEKSGDPKAGLKAKMYFPEEPEDCFLSEDVNKFPIEAIREHLQFLDAKGTGKPIELYRNSEGKVCFTFNTKLKEILEFPVKADTIKEAPIIMYEPPVNNPPHLLYIAGGDPYNQNTSATSPSLGTIHIYKRLYDPVAGTFQNMIVASFASRPKEMRDWHKTVEMLLEFYNATCMIENAGTNFIEFLTNKNKGYLLADGYNLLKDISPTTSIQNKPKGLPPTIKVIDHCMNLLYDYCNEELEMIAENGIIIKKLGVTRIPDKMLLLEMLNYAPKTNCDRIVSFRHVLAYDSYLQKISPLVKYSDTPEEPPKPSRIIHSPFNTRKSPNHITKLRNPFPKI